jgi:hypothetical protein
MKIKKIILLGCILISSISLTNAYLLWLKSSNNTIENIQQIEEKYKIRIPLVGFIFDPRGPYVIKTLNQLSSTLGTNRIYHITLSPNMYSAAEVANWLFDKQYLEFFETVKKNNLRVVFRTMHEMNGWRYPRSSNPEEFKKARIHVRELSRTVELTTENILFDFSVNHRDMPTKEVPSQKAKLIPCQIRNKEKFDCYTFEDYYPGETYVDIIWFTFYNRGKGNSDRKRLTPAQIVYEKNRTPLTRIKAFKKPIIIDEVGTTAVRYTEKYKRSTSREIYKKDHKNKNTRLRQLQQLLRKEQDIYWTVYFNVDYTKGLTKSIIGEADRSVIDIGNKKVYNTIFTLFKNSDDLHLRSPLTNLFGVGMLEINGNYIFVELDIAQKVRKTEQFIKKNDNGNREQFMSSFGWDQIKYLFPWTSDEESERILKILK